MNRYHVHLSSRWAAESLSFISPTSDSVAITVSVTAPDVQTAIRLAQAVCVSTELVQVDDEDGPVSLKL